MNEYDEGRIWFKRKGGLVTVGLTEKGLEEVGGVQAVNLPVEGEDCSADDVVAEVEGDRNSFEVIAPLDGVIEAANEALNDDIDLLATDPLDEGWIFKIRLPKDEHDEDNSED